MGRRYNPEMIQIRKPVEWIFSAVGGSLGIEGGNHRVPLGSHRERCLGWQPPNHAPP